MSTPYTLGYRTGGEALARYTVFAPALLTYIHSNLFERVVFKRDFFNRVFRKRVFCKRVFVCAGPRVRDCGSSFAAPNSPYKSRWLRRISRLEGNVYCLAVILTARFKKFDRPYENFRNQASVLACESFQERREPVWRGHSHDFESNLSSLAELACLL
jgi:hypothetical protein